jgi:hypothetical protein
LDPDLPSSAFERKHSSTVLYPPLYQPLARIIFSLSGDYTNIPVKFQTVKTKLGPKTEVKPLGFRNATKMIKAAWEVGLVRMAYLGFPAIFLVNASDDLSILVGNSFN